jgi:hypothetical protein
VGFLVGVISLFARFYLGVVLSVAFGIAMLVLTYVIVRRAGRPN